MAVDVQGPEKPQPYVDAANPRFNVVIDQKNVLGALFGYRAIPNGVFLDEAGTLRHRKFSGFDIRKPEIADGVFSFAADAGVFNLEPSEAVTYGEFFARGLALYEAGDVAGAATVWRAGIAVEPDHWNMRKQLWAIEHPERFYDGAVDYGWQKEQVERGE